MAFIDGIQRFEATLVSRLRASFDDAREARKQRKVYRRTYEELNALSNRELQDLGMSRSQLRSVALEAAKAS